MSEPEFKQLSVEEIQIDQKNPRFEKTKSQKEAINRLFSDLGNKMIKLAAHIAEHGLNPTQRICVFRERGKFVDGDGNRRISALKVLIDPKILKDANLRNRIDSIKKVNIPETVDCVVFENRKEAKTWISLNHNGQSKGEGVIPWNPEQKDRFNDIQSIGTQILNEFVSKDDKSKYQKTTMDRFFQNGFVRRSLSIELDPRKKVVFGKIERKKIKQVLDKLKGIKVKKVYDTEEIRKFYNECFCSPVGSGGPSKRSRPSTGSRTSVVPNDLELIIDCEKTNNVFHELKNIDCRSFPNASAALLRTFLELTVDYCNSKNSFNINMKGRLLSRFKECINKMDTLSTSEKKALEKIVSNKNNSAHTSILNSFVHNRSHLPDDMAVKNAFDNLVSFFSKVYDK